MTSSSPRRACLAGIAACLFTSEALAQDPSPAPAPALASPVSSAPVASQPAVQPGHVVLLSPTPIAPPWPPVVLPPLEHHTLSAMPVELPYDDQPIPAGYAVTTRAPRLPLVLGGSLLLGAWAGSMIGATVQTAAEGHRQDSGTTLPLFIPLAGPFITLHTAEPDGPSTFWLWVDGFTQVAGLTLMLTAAASEEERLVLRDPTPHQLGGLFSPNARYMWPRETRYDPSKPVPPGYHLEERVSTPVLATGLALFGATYGVSAFVGVTGLAAGSEGEEVGPLLIPLAGPMVTIASSRTDSSSAAVLVLDTVTQTAGATLLIISAFAKRKRLVRDDVPPPPLGPGPRLDVGPGRVSLRVPF